jgi:hypothetical protein
MINDQRPRISPTFASNGEPDVPVILSLIKALAEYERMAGDVVADEALVRSSFFGSAGQAEHAEKSCSARSVCSVLIVVTRR